MAETSIERGLALAETASLTAAETTNRRVIATQDPPVMLDNHTNADVMAFGASKNIRHRKVRMYSNPTGDFSAYLGSKTIYTILKNIFGAATVLNIRNSSNVNESGVNAYEYSITDEPLSLIHI